MFPGNNLRSVLKYDTQAHFNEYIKVLQTMQNRVTGIFSGKGNFNLIFRVEILVFFFLIRSLTGDLIVQDHDRLKGGNHGEAVGFVECFLDQRRRFKVIWKRHRPPIVQFLWRESHKNQGSCFVLYQATSWIMSELHSSRILLISNILDLCLLDGRNVLWSGVNVSEISTHPCI